MGDRPPEEVAEAIVDEWEDSLAMDGQLGLNYILREADLDRLKLAIRRALEAAANA